MIDIAVKKRMNKENDNNHNEHCVMADQIIELDGYRTAKRHKENIRRITYYAENKNKTYVYLTNNMDKPPEQVAFLYKYRWKVELFCK